MDTSTYRDINVLRHTEIFSCAIHKPEKSPGEGNIYPAVLRNIASVFSIPLCSIYQQGIE